MSKLITGILNSFKTLDTTKALSKNTAVAGLVISTEKLSSTEYEQAEAEQTQLENQLDNVFTTAFADSGVKLEDFPAASREAAITAAKMATNPGHSLRAPRKMETNENDVVYTAEQLGAHETVENYSLANEKFDGQDVSATMKFSLTWNLLASRQDEWNSRYYPLYALDAASGGMTLETAVTILRDNISRSSVTGNKEKFKGMSIVEAISKNKMIGQDQNRLVPRYHENTEDVMLGDFSYLSELNGKDDVTTAPIKFGETIDLIRVCEDEVTIKNGGTNDTDALDRRITLESIYFSISKEGSKEVFATDITLLPYREFTPTIQDSTSDLSIDFKTNEITLVVGKSKQAKTQKDSDILNAIPNAEGYVIKFNVVINGSTNVDDAETVVYGTKIGLHKVIAPDGKAISEDEQIYISIANAVKDAKLEGYIPEAYATNSNLRYGGRRASVARFNKIYLVPIRSGFEVVSPISVAKGNKDNDAHYLQSQIQLTQAMMNQEGVQTLKNQLARLRALKESGVDLSTIDTHGRGTYYTVPYFKDDTIDLQTAVDSRTSRDRKADIKSALENRLQYEVVEMDLESRYGLSLSELEQAPGRKIDIIVGVSKNLMPYVSAGLDIGENYNAIVVTTPNPLINNEIIVKPSAHDASKNEVSQFAAGVTAWRPEITARIETNEAGTKISKYVTNPSFLHINLSDIAINLKVTNLDKVLGKVAVKMQ